MKYIYSISKYIEVPRGALLGLSSEAYELAFNIPLRKSWCHFPVTGDVKLVDSILVRGCFRLD